MRGYPSTAMCHLLTHILQNPPTCLDPPSALTIPTIKSHIPLLKGTRRVLVDREIIPPEDPQVPGLGLELRCRLGKNKGLGFRGLEFRGLGSKGASQKEPWGPREKDCREHG